MQRHTKKVNLSCHRASHPVRRDSFIYRSPIQKCTKRYVNDEGLSKDTEIAALWVEKGRVYSKLPRLSPQKAERSKSGETLQGYKGTGIWEKRSCSGVAGVLNKYL